MKISVVGAGAWGSAFGKILQRNSHEVRYVHRYDTAWPDGTAGDYVIMAIPCQSARERMKTLPAPQAPVFSLIKGIEVTTHLRVTEIIREVWKENRVGAISGPSLASEVQIQAPTAVVLACDDEELAKAMQQIVHQKMFRTYRSTDVVGVELGGALKNVYALAGGICYGLGLGENGLAGLMTRSLVEMVRIAALHGARMETLYGLSGMGDLFLTAYSGASRNHQVGEALGRGRELQEILSHMGGTAEGVPTTRAVFELVESEKIKAPVVRELYKVLYEGKTPAEGFQDLMVRRVDEE
ncbi:MAG: NAD(P)-dependent glycerol-3-phosphate dehydrogenase [Methylacidiphilales bacterium]|nr:NAD(P)-dependent glycerol-3-phosphate dehydrogenase [Candidatus Methylacidiphilales bacterium]